MIFNRSSFRRLNSYVVRSNKRFPTSTTISFIPNIFSLINSTRDGPFFVLKIPKLWLIDVVNCEAFDLMNRQEKEKDNSSGVRCERSIVTNYRWLNVWFNCRRKSHKTSQCVFVGVLLLYSTPLRKLIFWENIWCDY